MQRRTPSFYGYLVVEDKVAEVRKIMYKELHAWTLER